MAEDLLEINKEDKENKPQDYFGKSCTLHAQHKGKLEIKSKFPLECKDDLCVAYTPGVSEPCKEIFKNPEDVYKYTIKGNSVAVVTDGSAVLGLGNIGPEAALPVMEGKCLLFKKFADIDAYPICIASQDVEDIIKTVKMIAPGFGGINLEDISAPRCFEVEERLKQELDIPVFHDDQHGTAIVALAALINALKVTGKNKEEIKVVINGAGAASIAVCKIFLKWGIKNIILVDSKGTIYEGRDNLNSTKEEMTKVTNLDKIQGQLEDAIKGTDVFVGCSIAGVLKQDMVRSMNKNPIIFALANPVPEIMPDLAKEAGAAIVATGRSDFENQINNVLAFPGIFRGALDMRAKHITEEMKLSAAKALASAVEDPTPNKIIPSVFDKGIADKIASSIKECNN
ncbi:MAG: malic enzyme-like NAD(P)-binding protein [archaeon]